MVPVKIETLVVSAPQNPAVIVLRPVEETPEGKMRIVPIWIGGVEAAQLSTAIERIRLPRPMTHDLFLDALTNLDARVDHVLINAVKGSTFFAKLVLRQGGRLVELDARPTDALSLALRQEAPLYIAEEVLERASFPFIRRTPEPNPEAQVEEFRTFLEQITPEDFKD